jgi:integrase
MEMKGTFGKRNKSWYFSIDLGKDLDGKRKRKWVSGFKTKKEAEKACNELVYNSSHNGIPDTRDMNLKSYLDLWLKQYAKTNVKNNTYENYTINIKKHINPLIGSIKLEKLTPLLIQDFYSKLSAENNLGNTTVNYIHRLLNNALKQAVKWNMLIINPCNAVTPPRKDKYEAITLTEMEVATLLDACKNDIMYTPILIACTTGMRRSEIAGLRWSDINFTEKTISVRHTYQKIDNQHNNC